MDGGSCRGYGWQTTLSLLSPLETVIPDSRHCYKMTICTACRSVHEGSDVCISRYGDMISLVLDIPTAIGNSNPLELNARTIQQLIAANLTLAAAWTWIQELMTAEDTGNVTSFPLVVTDEVYTLGFDAMVLNVLANMTVENSGNSSEPPPPIRDVSFWEAAWNTFTGLLSAAWNAVVAVATFIANVALAVIKWCIDFAVAIANGEGLTFFYNTVVKPFVDAVMAFIQWIIDMVKAAVRFVFSPVTNWIRGILDSYKNGILHAYRLAKSEYLVDGRVSSQTLNAFSSYIFGDLWLNVFLIGLVVYVLMSIFSPFIGPFAFLIPLIGAVMAAIVVVDALGVEEPDPPYPSANPPLTTDWRQLVDYARDYSNDAHNDDFTPEQQWTLWGLIFDFLALTYEGLAVAAYATEYKDIGAIAGLATSVIAMAVCYVSIWISGFTESKGFAILALILSIGSVAGSAIQALVFSASTAGWIMSAVAAIFGVISLALSILALRA